MSSWPANDRYGVHPAPGGLALVQDLLNTHAIAGQGADLLTSPDLANDWARSAVRAWSADRELPTHPPILTGRDTVKLRTLREQLVGLLGDRTDGVSATGFSFSAAAFAISDDGRM